MEYRKITIPLNPQEETINYINAMPIFISDRLSENIYKDLINNLNKIFLPKYSFSNILYLLFVIPFLIQSPCSYDDEVENILLEINKELITKGLLFRHPKYNNYLELDLLIYD